MSAGGMLGLQIIRGVELSAKEYPNFHILGYGFRAGETELSRLCEKLRAGRDDRKYRIVDFLRGKGVDIDLAEVEKLAGGEVIARPHFAQILVRHGYVSTNREAFDRYLDTEEFREKVKRFKADSRTCVEAIKSAGCKVSLAHPYQMGLPDGELEALVARSRTGGWTLLSVTIRSIRPSSRRFTCILQKSISSTGPAGATSTGKRSSRTLSWQDGRWSRSG